MLQNYGDEALAKRRAEKLRSCYSGNNYKKQKPCTTVDLLVEEIEHPEIYIDEEWKLDLFLTVKSLETLKSIEHGSMLIKR